MKKKKKSFGQYIAVAIYVLIGAACGLFGAKYLAGLAESMSFGRYMLSLCAVIIEMYAAIFLQLIIHESGHLVFGLLTGYTFSSFRIGSLMLIKTDGKTRVRRMSIAGTGGQCLMCPPDMADGKLPVTLYNLGGVIMNLLTAAVFGWIYTLTRGVPFVPGFCLMLAVAGAGLALTNGIPLRMGTVDNDGYNALSLGKNPAALRSFWVQLKVNAETVRGTRLKDMPVEWFSLPGDGELANSMVATMAVLYENRLMDEHRFSEAAELIDRLFGMETGIVGLYVGMMTCDRIYCGLIGGDMGKADKLLTKQQNTIMKQMKSFPAVIRTQYALALLKEHDGEKAAEYINQFHKCAESYPSQSDIESERELIAIASEKAPH